MKPSHVRTLAIPSRSALLLGMFLCLVAGLALVALLSHS